MSLSTQPDPEEFAPHSSDLTGLPHPGPTESIHPASDPLEVARRHLRHPEQIGPYRILEPLGEGAMGFVYLAEQHKPIHRRVALKVIKLGMDTRQVLARFETEREALALMNHPNVAKVLDAGVTEDGRPYFAMEHVAGVPITDYCDTLRLNTGERLGLFMDVCQAVQHAHQKGIIHRDIKPSNVLVAVQDDRPIVKVIDFGVAKATQHRLREHTQYTEQGMLLGTPGYMSPEQAGMTALDIDTRTDIYSLGVLLYELLVGSRPFDDRFLHEADLPEIQRIIRDVEPPKPSTRFSSLGADSTVVAHKRRTEPRTLSRELRGDLDWVVMKCLEKDRTRRYATANAVTLETRRHLSNEPVLAGPPTLRYRARKFVRRNRSALGVVAVLMAAFGVSAYFYWRARQAALAPALAAQYAEQAKKLQLAGEYPRSWDLSQKALELDPNNSLALRSSAYLLLDDRGDFRAALDAYNRGLAPLEQVRMLPEDFHNRARLRRIAGDTELAFKDHDRAIAFAPQVGFVYVSRGVTHRVAGNIDRAIEDFDQAIKCDPTFRLQCNLWTWEMRMLRSAPGDAEAAAVALDQAKPARPADSFDQLYADICRGAVTAELALRQSLDERQRAYAHYYLGAKALVDGRPSQARDWFQKCAASGQHRYTEFDFALWHLKRIASD
jgi:serine/threonine protein kinase